MTNKHPTKFTPQEVYDLSDRLLFAGHECQDEALKSLLLDAGRVLLNRETIVAQVRILTEGK